VRNKHSMLELRKDKFIRQLYLIILHLVKISYVFQINRYEHQMEKMVINLVNITKEQLQTMRDMDESLYCTK